MLKYITASMFIGISILNANNIQSLDALKAEKQALILQLETYTLKKKIIEIENFIANDKLDKEKKLERERALVRLKNDLRADRNNGLHIDLNFIK